MHKIELNSESGLKPHLAHRGKLPTTVGKTYDRIYGLTTLECLYLPEEFSFENFSYDKLVEIEGKPSFFLDCFGEHTCEMKRGIDKNSDSYCPPTANKCFEDLQFGKVFCKRL